MNTLAPEIDRISPCRRPTCRPAGYHRWSDLLFVHWRLPAEAIAPLLPAELTLDTWQGDAWVGLVPFRMSGVRPWWSPWGAKFLETNVRTYVHFRGREPGVWFFSLEANHRLAVRLARSLWRLNYQRADMTFERQDGVLCYRSRRRCLGAYRAQIEARFPAHQAVPLRRADAGSLEHFLIERYLLYSSAGPGRLWRGRVHHPPYLVQPAELLHLEESLLAANQISTGGPPCHVLYCPRVDVEVFPLIPVATAVW
jgi:uncharacterized protein YqjF (DUF2071 family)